MRGSCFGFHHQEDKNNTIKNPVLSQLCKFKVLKAREQSVRQHQFRSNGNENQKKWTK